MWVIFASLEGVEAANAISTELDIGRAIVCFCIIISKETHQLTARSKVAVK